jgi:hypothetical protein
MRGVITYIVSTIYGTIPEEEVLSAFNVQIARVLLNGVAE